MFQERQILTRTGQKIQEFTPGGIRFADGSELASDLTVFTPGLSGHPLFPHTDLPLTAAGFLPVDFTTQVQGVKHCYAVGDSSFFEGPAWWARQGHLAEVMARTAAANCLRNLTPSGDPTPSLLSFAEELNLLCIMDTGQDGVFIYRDAHRELAPRGAWARWGKLAWEHYYKRHKLKQVPRLI